MGKNVLTDEDRRTLRAVAIEILEIRRLVNELVETLVNMSDKQFLKALIATQNQSDLTESQVNRVKEKLDKQFDMVEKELGT